MLNTFRIRTCSKSQIIMEHTIIALHEIAITSPREIQIKGKRIIVPKLELKTYPLSITHSLLQSLIIDAKPPIRTRTTEIYCCFLVTDHTGMIIRFTDKFVLQDISLQKGKCNSIVSQQIGSNINSADMYRVPALRAVITILNRYSKATIKQTKETIPVPDIMKLLTGSATFTGHIQYNQRISVMYLNPGIVITRRKTIVTLYTLGLFKGKIKQPNNKFQETSGLIRLNFEGHNEVIDKQILFYFHYLTPCHFIQRKELQRICYLV
ncbi:protein of unknown function [Ruminococcaceae bacterium BL-6]|nr:protein of unknown function [Ruminococcaceae bacterium BL-6]